MATAPDVSKTIHYTRIDRVPLFACVASLTWTLYDYFLTLEDEVQYIWPTRWRFAKIIYFWIRFYTIFVTTFDVVQIHTFSKIRPSIAACVAMDPITRSLGAISLWSIEIVMQMRIYALYRKSKAVAVTNAILFIASIGCFLWLLVVNAKRRADLIREVIALPITGCPSVHGGLEYVQWIPATAFEGILFCFALSQTFKTMSKQWREFGLHNVSLYQLVVRDNLIYFGGVACILVFNILMVASATRIPWFSFGPFHAAMGILTTRLLLHLHKAVSQLLVVPKGEPSAGADRSVPIVWRVATRSDGATISTGEDQCSPRAFHNADHSRGGDSETTDLFSPHAPLGSEGDSENLDVRSGDTQV